jgi:hypothetical protein
MNYLQARRTFIREAAWWFASPEATMDVVAEVWWVGEKVTEEMRRILNKKADDLPAESEEVAKSGSLEQQSDSPAQGDLMAQGCGDDVEG